MRKKISICQRRQIDNFIPAPDAAAKREIYYGTPAVGYTATGRWQTGTNGERGAGERDPSRPELTD